MLRYLKSFPQNYTQNPMQKKVEKGVEISAKNNFPKKSYQQYNSKQLMLIYVNDFIHIQNYLLIIFTFFKIKQNFILMILFNLLRDKQYSSYFSPSFTYYQSFKTLVSIYFSFIFIFKSHQ
ncbi:transmembrane protein, putative (macronuclear) [Tetrahymena thermophila SB210]|uniref:Transmembrane protein, putative n=1 Tax=Tetrahymena thermophila (strain SB210) TaxID=312017 RepID=W7X6F2_TETTS|nr:transmembrane protein, putative [Tetrahymena thermophila SB210]EWS71933.1 transmembrane protein, putative [Tetrahymena thermophila SB210]|eukprot:XP_012655534.1 transmembrane protein, putative [Tetrahymena thermophila SB210]